LQTGGARTTIRMANLMDICGALPVWSYEPEDVVIQEDLKDGKIFILKSGAVEVRKHGLTVNRSASPGAVFGEVSALLNTGHSASVLAIEPTEFFVAEDGESFLRENPELNLHIARLLAFRLQRVTEQLVQLEERIEASDKSAVSVDGVLKSLADQFVS